MVLLIINYFHLIKAGPLEYLLKKTVSLDKMLKSKTIFLFKFSITQTDSDYSLFLFYPQFVLLLSILS